MVKGITGAGNALCSKVFEGAGAPVTGSAGLQTQDLAMPLSCINRSATCVTPPPSRSCPAPLHRPRHAPGTGADTRRIGATEDRDGTEGLGYDL